ncbi:hypothetical protein D9M68_467000 [compost metagenome]
MLKSEETEPKQIDWSPFNTAVGLGLITNDVLMPVSVLLQFGRTSVRVIEVISNVWPLFAAVKGKSKLASPEASAVMPVSVTAVPPAIA